MSGPLVSGAAGRVPLGRGNLLIIAKDRILFSSEDVDLLVHVGNNPVNWIDPRGLTAVQLA